MRVWLVFLSQLWIVFSAGAMGFTEDPQEKLTKSWDLAAVKTLEIRGQVDFELVPGPEPKVTVEASRALFDQLTVSNWWGAVTVAVESGLRGPREQGPVKVIVILPDLIELTVSDRSIGRGTWPGASGTVRVGDRSTLDLTLDGGAFEVEASWLTVVTLRGKVDRLLTTLRHQSRADTTRLTVGEAEVALDEESVYEAGSTGKALGTVRHTSKVQVTSARPWEGVVFKEDSVLEDRTGPPPP